MIYLVRLSFVLVVISLTCALYSQCDQKTIDSLGYPSLESVSRLDIIESKGSLLLKAPNVDCGKFKLKLNGEETELIFRNGQSRIDVNTDHGGELLFLSYQNENGGHHSLTHVARTDRAHRIKNIPLWLSIIPPLLAIILALIFKEVILSLFAGIWSGAFIAGGLRIESMYYFLESLFNSVTNYVVNALNDGGHLAVIVFSLLIGGMVAIISKNGGMAGVVRSLSKYARSKRSSSIITWLLGIAIFFDDYANTLIVGNTMRPVTDKFRISREKLAYIVDSTAAPVSAIAFITTWIGAELGYIDDAMTRIALATDSSAYVLFISSLKYSFYPILTLIFVLMVIYMRRDFGPMLKADRRAFTTGQVSPAKTDDEDEPDMEDLTPVKGAKLRWYNAAIPVFVVIGMTMFGLVDTGMESLYGTLQEIDPSINNNWSSVWSSIGSLLDGNASFFSKLGKLIGASDSYTALIWASLSGVVIAIILTVSQRIMNLFDTMHWMTTGFKTMLPALIILTMAWALAITTNELHTAEFLSSTLADSINPYLVPTVIFVLAAAIAFSTGSSWSTMAILYPIAIPTTYAVCQANGISPEVSMELLLNVIATVLAASVLGDHCSPISDTTILSSLATDCNHIDHVKTQLPYALTVGVVSLMAVTLSTYFGGGLLICFVLLLASIAVLWLILVRIGKNVEHGLSS